MARTKNEAATAQGRTRYTQLFRNARLAWSLLRDPRVPLWQKLVPFAGLAYILSPIDLMPEAVMGPLGIGDDLAVLLIALKVFIDMVPAEALAEAAGEPAPPGAGEGETIESDYRVVDE